MATFSVISYKMASMHAHYTSLTLRSIESNVAEFPTLRSIGAAMLSFLTRTAVLRKRYVIEYRVFSLGAFFNFIVCVLFFFGFSGTVLTTASLAYCDVLKNTWGQNLENKRTIHLESFIRFYLPFFLFQRKGG